MIDLQLKKNEACTLFICLLRQECLSRITGTTEKENSAAIRNQHKNCFWNKSF